MWLWEWGGGPPRRGGYVDVRSVVSSSMSIAELEIYELPPQETIDADEQLLAAQAALVVARIRRCVLCRIYSLCPPNVP